MAAFVISCFTQMFFRENKNKKTNPNVPVLKNIALNYYVNLYKKYMLMGPVLVKLLDKGLIVITGLVRRLSLKLLISLISDFTDH